MALQEPQKQSDTEAEKKYVPRLAQPLSEDRIKGSYGIGVGILLFVGLSVIHQTNPPVFVMWLLMIPAMAVYVPGCAFYARSKGYPWWVGLVGFGAVLGLIPLILLPDRTSNTYKETIDIQRKLKERHEAKKKTGA